MDSITPILVFMRQSENIRVTLPPQEKNKTAYVSIFTTQMSGRISLHFMINKRVVFFMCFSLCLKVLFTCFSSRVCSHYTLGIIKSSGVDVV